MRNVLVQIEWNQMIAFVASCSSDKLKETLVETINCVTKLYATKDLALRKGVSHDELKAPLLRCATNKGFHCAKFCR